MPAKRNVRTIWSDDEKELLAVRARQIRRDNPDVGFVKLFILVQDVLPPERRRCWHNREGDAWLIAASHAPSAPQCGAHLVEHLATILASAEAVTRTLGAFLGIPEETIKELLSVTPGDSRLDGRNDVPPKPIGRNSFVKDDRQMRLPIKPTHANGYYPKRP